MVGASKPVAAKPLASKVKIYKASEINIPAIIASSRVRLGKTLHEFQTGFFANVMQGRDIVLDIGTGSGKSLCFDLPVLSNSEYIVIIVSPLSALMLEQASASLLESIAICKETLTAEGQSALYKRAVEGAAQRIFVSPEIAGSLEFSKKVLSQPRFQEHLRLVFIDEAHCIGKDAVTISMSNARPNIALSVRKIVHPDDTKADLRFLIRDGASTAADVDVTLVYLNTRIETEDTCDQLQSWATEVGIDKSAIAFYHAKIGTARKRALERMLRDCEIRILCCTDAVGMGCDMRNIVRVVLWKLPPSFCALVQRSGRVVRDFSQLGEAILFVTAKVLKDGIAEAEARATRQEAAEPQNQEGDDVVPDAQEGQDVVANQAVAVGEGGSRVERNAEADEADPEVVSAAEKKKKRKAARVSASDALEASFLTRYSSTTLCRRLVWDEYFKNNAKGARCCDICDPTRFPVPLFVVEKKPGLKGGKKRKFPTDLSDAIRTGLRKWSREVLMPKLYPVEAGFSMTGSALLPDITIEQLAMCGERVDTVQNLQRRARWFLMPYHGPALLQEFQRIVQEYDDADAGRDSPEPVPPGDIFDAILRGRGRARGRAGGRARGRGRGIRGEGSRARSQRRGGGT
ncbi:P-loop containing nucleoside triphosphate hydrolase protein [Mycena sp. CBHHK59/15]|nr:P-loop containing nucleoside triphosphate hydrolase protein [Mycena sp. CBHHK59/15]